MRASGIEVNKLERKLPFLATTASIAPFIGLFGTVWGIIIAFEAIGVTGSSELLTSEEWVVRKKRLDELGGPPWTHVRPADVRR